MDRLELVDRLAEAFGLQAEHFITPSKVPVPDLSGESLPSEQLAQRTIELIEDIARHHQAKVHSISPDLRFFYLAHRGGRLTTPSGTKLIDVVHDNTLEGGERVAELVSSPMLRRDLDPFLDVLRWVAELERVHIPDTAAMHVHLDARPLSQGRAIGRFARIFETFESEIRQVTRCPSGLRRAKSLPAGLVDAIEGAEWESAPREVVAAIIDDRVKSREHGLNLYNVAHPEQGLETVELKVAGSTLDPARVRATRELCVRLVEAAVFEETLPPASEDLGGWLEGIGLAEAHRAALLRS